ncbi:hypothetical protein ACROYT_G035259 [Oculina patagonica]
MQDRLAKANEDFENLYKKVPQAVDKTEAMINKYNECSKLLEESLEWLTKASVIVDSEVAFSLDDSSAEEQLAKLKELLPELETYEAQIASIEEKSKAEDVVGKSGEGELQGKLDSIRRKWEALKEDAVKKEERLMGFVQAKENYTTRAERCKQALDDLKKSSEEECEYSVLRDKSSAQLETRKKQQEKCQELEEQIRALEEAGDQVTNMCEELREPLQRQLRDIKDEWLRINTEAVIRQEQLEAWISEVGDIHSDVDACLARVKTLHDSLQSCKSEGTDIQTANEILGQLKQTASELESEKSNVDSLVEKGETLLTKLDPSEKVELEESFLALQSAFNEAERDSKERVHQAEERINDIIEFDKESAHCESLLTIYQAAVPVDVSCTVETLEGQMGKLKRLYGDMESRETHMATLYEKEAKLSPGNIAQSGRTSPDGKAGQLQGDWGKLKASVGEKLRELERLAQTKKDFDDDYETCLAGVQELETAILALESDGGAVEKRVERMQELCSRIKSYRNKLDLLTDRCDELPNVAYEQKNLDPRRKLSSVVKRWEEVKDEALGKLNEFEKEKVEVKNIAQDIANLQSWIQDVSSPFVEKDIPPVIQKDDLEKALIANTEFRTIVETKNDLFQELLGKSGNVKGDGPHKDALLSNLQDVSRDLEEAKGKLVGRDAEIRSRIKQHGELVADLDHIREMLMKVKGEQSSEPVEFEGENWIDDKITSQRVALARLDSCELFLTSLAEKIVKAGGERKDVGETELERDFHVLSEEVHATQQHLSKEILQLEKLRDFDNECVGLLSLYEDLSAKIRAVDFNAIAAKGNVAHTEEELVICHAVDQDLSEKDGDYETLIGKENESLSLAPVDKKEDLESRSRQLRETRTALKKLIQERIDSLRNLVAEQQTLEGWLKTAGILTKDAATLLSENEGSLTLDSSRMSDRSQALVALIAKLEEYETYSETFQGGAKASEVARVKTELSKLKEQLASAENELQQFKEQCEAFEIEATEATAVFKRYAAEHQTPASLQEAQEELANVQHKQLSPLLLRTNYKTTIHHGIGFNEISQRFKNVYTMNMIPEIFYFIYLEENVDLLKEVDSREKALSTRGEQVSGKLNEIERKEFEDRLRKLSEEWQKAKEQLHEQRELLEDGINSCMKHLEIVEQAKTKATEIDQLLSEINDAKEENMETVESKTQDLREKLEIFESLMASMTDIAATVPWKESTEQESTEASLETIRNDAKRKQQELHETISFHKQYREAVVKASDCLCEIEEKLVDKESLDYGLQNRPLNEELQQILDDVAPILQTASEKGKLLTMMEPHGARGKDEIQAKLSELSDKWEELQTKLHDKIAKSEKCEAVTALNNEVETVSRRLDELAASTEDLTAATYDTANVIEHREGYESISKEVSDLQGSVEDLSSRCQELLSSVPSRESEELGEQLVTLKVKCENLEGHVAEKEEEFEETLWRWQEFQSDVDACFRNLAMIEKSLDFQSLDDGELEDRRETHQMLSDNLDFQESIIRDVKDRANEVLGMFPPADVDKAKVKLISLDQRFLLVKERLQRRQEEMLKSSVDWHEFECGLKSCLEWVLRAEDRLAREVVDLPENETDIGRLKAFSDELDVRQGDFESIRSQGDRLVCQLSDRTERETIRKQMDDISHRLERIQNLVNDRGQRVGERTHYGVVEFEEALKDCYERIEQFKSNLREVKNLESIEREQDLHSELEFIQSLARNIHEQGQTLLPEIPDVEKDAIKEKLERLQQDIATLEETPLASHHANGETPGREGASGFVEEPMAVAERKPAGHDEVENGDSDLGDSESGVSSMESFEGILRKENGHGSSENDVQENGVSDERFGNDESDDNAHVDGGLSVSPDEYQRIRMNHSADTDQDTSSSRDLEDGSRATSRETDDKSGDVSVPLLIVTDEDGTPAEVEFAENGTDDSQDNEGLTDQAGEFFFDDFDVYYGDSTPKTVIEPDQGSVRDDTIVSEKERDVPKSDSFVVKESSSDEGDTVNHLANGDVSDDQSNDLVIKDKSQPLKESVVTDVTDVTLPSYKTVTANALQDDFDVSADSELGDDILRHSTPVKVVASTVKEENTTPDPRDSSSDSIEQLVNGAETQGPPRFEEDRKANSFSYRDYNADTSGSNSSLDTTPTKSRAPTSQTGVQAGLVSPPPNEEMEKLDRLFNIGEHSSENIAKDVESEKPHVRIASILSERRKAEEAERLRFAESSVRDTDYELFTSRPLDLIDRSSPLKDLDDSENLLHENMSLDSFLVEVEKLLEKLRSIEELITTDMEDEDNVKDELAKHVALCVLMSKQQDRLDQMNLLSQSYLHGSAGLNIILEERLREVNALWKEVQMRASSKQEVLERCVQEQTQNLESTRQQEVMAFTENFSFLRSLYLTVDCCDDVCARRRSEVVDGDEGGVLR